MEVCVEIFIDINESYSCLCMVIVAKFCIKTIIALTTVIHER